MLLFFLAGMLAGSAANELPAIDHIVAEVTRGSPAAIAEAAAPAGDLLRADDGLFYVTGVVNGMPVRFLVDTGASTIVLTRDDAMRAGLLPPGGAFHDFADTANGRASIAWISIEDLSIGRVRVRDISAAVVRDGLEVSLLGQNWLSQLASLTIAGDRLQFR